MGELKILGFGGSLRKNSINRKLLEFSAGMVPEGVSMEIYDISRLPFFNEDDESDPPSTVVEFKKKLSEADGVIIATPEYNYSVPGYLKNAIDIASRFGVNSFDRKPVALMSASPSMLGGSRAQYHMRQSFVYLNARVINKPEVFLPQAMNKFDGDGNLNDSTAVGLISDMFSSLVTEIRVGSQSIS